MILVTGSNGFVGTHLCRALGERGMPFRAAVRQSRRPGDVAVGDLTPDTDWQAALFGCTAVIHLAARVHIMSDTEADPLRAYRRVNVDASLNLARQAVEAGVRRFVFVSSVKVNGEGRESQPYTATEAPAPQDPYGQSKLEAETALLAFGAQSGLEVVIVRPPLVYGAGVKANFLSLVKLVRRGFPLPFASARGKRSMVNIDNLVDLLILCTSHPQASGRVFMVSDGYDVTVGELAQEIAQAQGKRLLLLPFPPALMRGAAAMVGASGVVDRLLGSLQVDIAETRERLGWEPKVSLSEGIRKTIQHLD